MTPSNKKAPIFFWPRFADQAADDDLQSGILTDQIGGRNFLHPQRNLEAKPA